MKYKKTLLFVILQYSVLLSSYNDNDSMDD